MIIASIIVAVFVISFAWLTVIAFKNDFRKGGVIKNVGRDINWPEVEIKDEEMD